MSTRILRAAHWHLLNRGLSTEQCLCPDRSSLRRSLHGLAVEREIETLALDLIGHAQADEDVNDLENDQRHNGVAQRMPIA